MKVRSHHLAAALFAGAIFLSASAWLSVITPSAIATCSGGANIVINNPAAGTIVSGTYSLSANSPATPAPTGVTFVISAPATQVIGDGSPNTAGQPAGSGPAWSYAWNSTSISNGNYQLSAIAHYSGGSANDCTSSPVPITVQNSAPTQTPSPTTQTPKMDVSISPNTWQGAPGQKGTFVVSGTYTTASGAHYPIDANSGAQVVWDTTTGTVVANGSTSSVLTLGSAGGDFILGAKVTMSSMSSRATAAIRVVLPSTSGKSSPTPTPLPQQSKTPEPVAKASPTPVASPAASVTTNGLSASDTERLEKTPTIFHPPVATNSQPDVAVQNLACLEKKLGTRYRLISSGTDSATHEDRLKAVECFSGSERIPAALAPVEPIHIDQVPITESVVTITKAKNENITNKKGDKVAAILLTGTAAPNSDVFVYIFSDPMVLKAKTDNKGQWTYVLQNPLKPGHHEIYAVAAKDSGNFVRTSAIPVSIAAAAQGNQDGSLIIESKWQAAQVAYIAAAVLMVIIAIILLFRMRRTHKTALGPNMIHPASAPAPEIVYPTGSGPTTMYAQPKDTAPAAAEAPSEPKL